MQALSGIQPLTIEHLEHCSDSNSARIDVWLDGWSISMVTGALFDHALWRKVMDEKSFMLSRFVSKYQANEVYLNMALRVLSGLGWLGYRDLDGGKDVLFYHTPRSSYMFRYAPALYEASCSRDLWQNLSQLLHRDWTPQEKMHGLRLHQAVRQERIKASHENADAIQKYVALAMEGTLVVPLLSLIESEGSLAKEIESLDSWKSKMSSSFFNFLATSFELMSWANCEGGSWKLTPEGRQILYKTSACSSAMNSIGLLCDMRSFIYDEGAAIPKKPHYGINSFWRSLDYRAGLKGQVLLRFKELRGLLSGEPKTICFFQCSEPEAVESISSILNEFDSVTQIVVTHSEASIIAAMREYFRDKPGVNPILVESTGSSPVVLEEALVTTHGISLKDMLHVNLMSFTRLPFEPHGYEVHSFDKSSQGVFRFGGERLTGKDAHLSQIRFLKNWAPYYEQFGCISIERHVDLGADQRQYTPGMLNYAVECCLNEAYPLERESFEHALSKADIETQALISSGDLPDAIAIRYLK